MCDGAKYERSTRNHLEDSRCRDNEIECPRDHSRWEHVLKRLSPFSE
jgi:hypothetical protein